MRIAIIAALLLPFSPLSLADPGAVTHCAANERVVFSCKVKAKVVSICSVPREAPYEALEYRYGVAGKIEMTYRATEQNKNRFHAYVEPVAPRALVNQVWFDRGGYRYLVSQCEGGNCPAKGGLVVYTQNKSIQTVKCEGGFNDHAWFDSAVIDFKSSFAESSSMTPLIILDETANDIQSLYPYRLSR